jgi:mycothiol synthase
VKHRVRPATWDDLAAVAELSRTCDRHDWGTSVADEQDFRDDWNLPRMRMETDTWLVEDATGLAVGYAFVTADPLGTEVKSIGFVHPEHRGRGIGSLLVDRVMARSREMLDGAGVLRCFAPGPDRAAAELFTASGFRLARSLQRMEAAIDVDVPFETGSPDGVTVRMFEPGSDDRSVHATLMEAFAGHYGFSEEPFDEWSAVAFDRETFDPTLWFVAEADGEVAGALIGVVRLDMGWIADIGVRERWRRRGIGERLVRRSLESFRARGFRSVGLNVDPDNETGAMRLYERLGFRFERRFDFYEREL